MIWVGVALAGSALLFMPGLLEQFETPKIELVRTCGLGALAYGLVRGRAGYPRRWSTLDWAVAAWLLVEILATLFSVSPRVSVVGETRQREGLLTSLALVGLYFAARDAFTRTPSRIRPALDLMLGLATLVGLYAIVQVAGSDPMQWRREAGYAGVYVRPFATLGHPNLLGLLAAATAAMGVALAVATKGGASRWLSAAAAVLLVVVTILTLSRAAWLGLGAGLLIATALALRERGVSMLAPRVIGITAAGVAVGLVIVVATGAWNLVAQRLAELFGGGSGSSRLEIWRTALAAWRDRPLIGNGPDALEMVFPHFQTPAYWRFEWSGLPFHAHSIYLHTLATRGVLGLLAAFAWAAALAAAGLAAWRRRGERMAPGLVPAAAGFVATCAVAGAFGALGIAGALAVAVLSAAVASAAEAAPAPDIAHAPAAARGERSRRPRGEPSAAGRRGATARARVGIRQWAARLASGVVAVATLVWGFTELRASRAGSAAQAFMTRAPARAAQASGVALTLAPHDDRLWRMHAQTLLWLTALEAAPAGTLADAEAAARRAVALAPERAENRLILARALGTREANGDTTARAPAEAEFRRSFALAPMDGLNLMEYADHETLLGRATTALEAARRALALYPNEGQIGAVLARAWLAAGEPDSARVALERALSAGWRNPAERQEAERTLEALRAAAGAGASPAGL
jgi:O-antigen ligase